MLVGCRGSSPAGPPSFPDIGRYTPVAVADDTITLPNPGRASALDEVYFLTPDGITCTFTNPAAAGCTGNNIFGIEPQDTDPYTFVGTDSGIQPATTTPYVDGTIQGHRIKALPPFHSITVDGVVCGVDGSGTTACKDPQSGGFVLSSRGSAWLPHV
ncbi:hypothetical protein [Mycobacterium sp. 1423905.2]|uniref:hypothetical protein n=1 Tax=Mycobacterium sp. 1423905.2 TaxID=1856859 RepID=UPI0020A347A1|nr:hypothetical protein [Mycobacterium sp. 1423905.2]